MAFVPCSIHGAMFKGGASTFFPALVEGGESRRARLKVCPNCATELLEAASQYFIKVSEGDVFFKHELTTTCAIDQTPLGEDRTAFFLSAYPRGLVETQWYGQLCPKCVNGVAETWGIEL